MIQLSNIAPDWESLVAQLQSEAGNFASWTDRVTGATGQTIIEMIAAIGAYSQFAVESSYQETFPDSAKNAESLYAAANFAGVRLSRKNPTSIVLNMVAPSTMTIDPYTQFVGAGTKWFNRQAVNLTTSPSSVTLYQGEVVRKQTFGLGTDFQAFVSVEKDFIVSDTDVLLSINSVNVPCIIQGLWTKKNLPGVQQFTLPDGQMIMLFGNNVYGSRPGPNDVCEITYVTTLGSDGNNIATSQQTIVVDGNPLIKGVVSGTPNGGGNEPDPVVYKNVVPAMFGAFDSAVTGPQYKALPLQYPGVVDARVLAQREINPYALTFMNTMKVSLLTTDGTWDSTQWNNFVAFFNAGSMYSTRVIRADPTAVNVTIGAIVSCKTFANLPNVKAKIEAALTDLFSLRQGSLGLDIYMSDVITTIQEADSNVEYVQLTNPTSDLVLSSLNVSAPVLTEVLGGGTLPVGTYDYGLSVTSTLGGSSAPANWSSITTTQANSSVKVDWSAVPNAASYSLYGRVTGSNLGFITTLTSPTVTYTDTGSVSPTPPVPAESTIATFYPNLSGTNIVMQYTNRNIRS